MELAVFDVGGTEVKYSLMGEDLIPRENGYAPTPEDGFGEFIALLEGIWRRFEDRAQGIALSMGGFINADEGICIGSGKEYHRGMPIASVLSRRCGCPVTLENDGKCAALAEHVAGALRGTVNSAAYIIGTYIGGGLILNGELLHGPRYVAGEFSFMCASQDWFGLEKNNCGNQCSTSALLREYGKEGVDGREFFRRYDAGDIEAFAALDKIATNAANQIASIANLLDLERVAIGGGVSRHPAVVNTIREKVEWYYRDSELARTGNILPGPEIVPCAFGSEANQIGAYLNFRKRNPD